MDKGVRKPAISTFPFELGVVERRWTSDDRAGRDQFLPRIPDEPPSGAEAPRNIAEYLENLYSGGALLAVPSKSEDTPFWDDSV
ncbi:MAG: hypothetical protein O7F76_12335, partial [Planctomycetota bacterium]|nr:hypothetical protein [Planctomycetota bacterium]